MLPQLLLLLALPYTTLALVHQVTSLDFFYDTVNRNDSYTVVKYFTTWCSHCKQLGPVVEQLSSTYSAPVGANVTFLEVNCELFGSTLCDRLPGFPVLELVKPTKEEPPLPLGEQPQEQAEEQAGWWSRLVGKLFGGGHNPEWQLDLDRVVEFRGNRNTDVITNFLDQVIYNDYYDEAIAQVLENRDCTHELCTLGKAYLKDVTSTSKERKRLENILKNNKDDGSLDKVRFKLRLIGSLEDANHDEL